MTLHKPFGDVGRTPYLLQVSDFLLLDEAGRFDGQSKTELLGGEIYFMNAQHRPHARAKMHLYDAFRGALAGQELAVMVEASVQLSDHDAPEPDLTLTNAPDGDGLIPGSAVFLIVEVADATLAGDLGKKATLYAAANVLEYWVADVNARVIHQLWNPVDGAFVDRREIAFGKPVTAATIPDLTIATERL